MGARTGLGAALALALAAAAAAQDCYADGERAQGAAGFPQVDWKPCCNADSQQVEVPALGWGKFCQGAAAPDPPAADCYADGERAQGAAGFPQVDWKPCCNADSQQVEVAALGWGKFCQGAAAPEPPSADCYADGGRAQGAAGFPQVDWKPCCNGDSQQVEVPALGWGKFCQGAAASDPPQEDCYADGERAQGAAGFPGVEWKPCCNAASQQVEVAALGWGKFCQAPNGGNGNGNGDDAEYFLSDLPLFAKQNGYGEMELDKSTGEADSNDGVPMSINGQQFQKGLGVHATSLVIVALQGNCKSFSSFIGIDDETRGPKAIPGGPYGSVVFEVFVDGNSGFKSNVFNGGDAAGTTGNIDLQGAQELTLVVTDANGEFTKDHADWADAKVVCSAKPNGDASKLKSTRGQWEGTLQWPVKSIHASLIPGNNGAGIIISHASKIIGEIGNNDVDFPHDMTKVDTANVGQWDHAWVDRQGEEMYCSGHVVQGGGVLEFGGHGGHINWIYLGKKQTSRYDTGNGWTILQDMVQPRWYPTALTLGNGEILSIAGSNGDDQGNIYRPEVYNPATNAWRTLQNVNYEGLLVTPDKEIILDDTYPFCVLASDGRVLWAGWDESMAYIDINGNGAWEQKSQRENFKRAWASPLLIRVDVLLLVGGLDPQLKEGKAFNSVVKMDFKNGNTPTVSYTGAMTFPRVDTQATILPDGTAFVNGGGNEHILGASPTHIKVGEIYDHTTGKWSWTAAAENPRGYHSTALLLPDGRVWTAGGECSAQPDGQDNCPSGKTAEVFSPPYLFNDDGSLAARPNINDASVANDKNSIVIQSNSNVARVTLVRVGSATHHMNFDQRFLELDFEASGNAGQGPTYNADVPTNKNVVPPGHYLLSIINPAGVPSNSWFVEL